MDTELLRLRERVLVAGGSAPLQLHGARTKDFYGESLAGEPLDLSGYRGIIDYEPSELVIIARCGTRLSDIETALAGRGQFLGFEPPRPGRRSHARRRHRDRTVRSAAHASGSGARFRTRRHPDGADGELLRFGGQVMKNVAGFDVSRLLCGSLGIFGIITELSIKFCPSRAPRKRCGWKCRRARRWRLSIAGVDNLYRSQAPPGMKARRGSGCRVPSRRAGGTRGDRRRSRLSRIGTQVVGCLTPLHSPGIFRRVGVAGVGASTAPPLQLPFEPLIDWVGALRWYSGDVSAFDVRGLALAAGGTALHWRAQARRAGFIRCRVRSWKFTGA